jgi:hypothetical protein
VLSRRALNRALLARQLLLARQPLPIPDAVERLLGLQTQVPIAPYVGLWSRITSFRPEDMSALVAERQLVRMPLMRATLHLVTGRDGRRMRPVIQPALERMFRGSPFPPRLAGVDLAELRSAGRDVLSERPLTRAQLAPLLARQWPDHDPIALAYGVTYLEPVLQVPPRGLWGQTGPAAWAPVQVEADEDPRSSLHDVICRYLAAFGPATVKDVQAWSGLTRLHEVTEQLSLRTFRGEDGQVLLDVPDSPLPASDTPAPVRFLPEYDNSLLGYADRSRIIAREHQQPVFTHGAVLVDGFVQARWQRVGDTIAIDPFRPIARRDQDAVVEEGQRLAGLLVGPTRGDVQIHALL